jgi:hypothetical protein
VRTHSNFITLPLNDPYAQLCSIQLVDSYYCNSATNYISSLLVSLATMLQLELPHVNVLSKIDLIEKYGRLGKL